jgi:ABC-type siderophore export system fused ATPase/permease subunit
MLFITATLSILFSQYILLRWIEYTTENKKDSYDISYIISTVIFILILNIFSVISLQYFSYRLIIYLYTHIIEKVLKSPLHLIFKNTDFPSLLTYLNKDLSTVHSLLPSLLSRLAFTLTMASFPLLFSAFNLPSTILLSSVFTLTNLVLFSYYHSCMNKIAHLSSKCLANIQKSTSELLHSSIYIRTYTVGTHLLRGVTARQTELSAAVGAKEGVENWFRIRMNLLCVGVFAAVSVVWLLDEREVDAVVVAMVLLGMARMPEFLERAFRVAD